MTNKEKKLARWNEPGSKGFLNWCEDVKPCVIHKDRRYSPIEFECWQREIITEALEANEDGSFKHNLSLIQAPRRHSKSTLHQLICLWLITSRQNTNIIAVGNSEEHSIRVMFRPLLGIIENTTTLKAFFSAKNSIVKDRIIFKEFGSSLSVIAPSMSSVFGDKISVLWLSDYHSQPDLDPINALFASLLDTENSLVLIDSNVDFQGGHVHQLELEAEENPKIYCKRIEYKSFEEYKEKAPSWIDRDKVETLRKTQLESAFLRDILGQRGSGQYALFPDDIIKGCEDTYEMPVSKEALRSIINGRESIICGGLDRSKRVFGGDNTIWTVTLKVASSSGEPEIYILNQQKISPNTAQNIKKAILKDHEKYKLNNVVLENYEVGDLVPWLDSQNIPNEVLPATSQNQNYSFLEFHRIAKETRLRLPKNSEELVKEMRTFVYSETNTGKFSFGHSSSKFHDDRVYSLNWSIFAGRKQALSMYVLGNVFCTNKRPNKHLCFLLGGDMIPLCSDTCKTYHDVTEFHKHFTRLTVEEISLPTFFDTYVRIKGAKVYQSL